MDISRFAEAVKEFTDKEKHLKDMNLQVSAAKAHSADLHKKKAEAEAAGRANYDKISSIAQAQKAGSGLVDLAAVQMKKKNAVAKGNMIKKLLFQIPTANGQKKAKSLKNLFTLLLPAILCSLLITGCGEKEKTVTVYTSVDRNFSEQVFKDFEAKTGIRVLAGYDTEASKTTGMVNKLVEEAANPRADVFWNGEFSQTIMLKGKDVLTPYKSKSADSIPDKYKDGEGYWTAFGGRARCILVNTELLKEEDYPSSYSDFLNDKYPADKIGMAYPLFGTTATHAAAIYAFRGEEKAGDFFRKLYERGIRIVDGNGVVRDLVVDGQLIFGITDTDDALGAVEKGAKVSIIFPDQGENDEGTLIIPNTVAMVKKKQQNDNAKVFIDYLLSEETEKYLVEIGWIQAPVRDIDVESAGIDLGGIKTLDVSLDDVYDQLEKSIAALKEIYIR